MILLVNNDTTDRVDWVYRSSDGQAFNACEYWLVVFNKDVPSIYGLGFYPFERGSDGMKPDNCCIIYNEELLMAVARITRDNLDAPWRVVEPASTLFSDWQSGNEW